MTGKQNPLIPQIWTSLGCPGGDLTLLKFLSMIVVVWADGSVQTAELEAIRKALLKEKVGKRFREILDPFLENPPGPYIEHRVINLIRLIHAQMQPGQAVTFAGDLAAAAESVDRQTFRLIQKLFDPDDQTAERIVRLRQSLAEQIRPDVQSLQRRVFAGRSPGPRSGRSDAAESPGTLSPTVRCSMHEMEGSFFQLRVLDFHEKKRQPSVALACVESFQTGADLDEDEVRTALSKLTHRPEIERWVHLYLKVMELSRTPNPLITQKLIDTISPEIARPIQVIGPAEMADLEDLLARSHGWVEAVEGTMSQIRVDADGVTRRVAPGAFRCSWKELCPPELFLRPVPSVAGLTFRVLRLSSVPGQPKSELALATPMASPDPTPEYVRWLTHFLPLMCHPLSTLLFDYASSDEPSWFMELRSGFPENPESLPASVLPSGRALIVPPWFWLRLSWALGMPT